MATSSSSDRIANKMPTPKYPSIALRRRCEAVERLLHSARRGNFALFGQEEHMENREYREGGGKQGSGSQNQDAPETNRKQSPGREESSEGITGQPKPGREGNEQGSGRQAPGSGQTPGEDNDEQENDRGKQAGGSQGGSKQAPGREQGGNEQTGGAQPGGQRDRSHDGGGSEEGNR
jgi:hypothetical protein